MCSPITFLSLLVVLTVAPINWAQAQLATSETEPNNTPGTATPLDVSSGLAMANGAIAPIGDQDYFSFVAPPGSKAWIFVDTGGTNGTDLDSLLTLFHSDGLTILEEDDDDGSGNGCDGTLESAFASAIAGRTLTAGGTYYLRVGSYNDEQFIPSYQLFLVVTTNSPVPEVETNNTPSTANPIISSGVPVGLRAGTIGVANDVDVYPIVAAAGALLFISLDCDPERDGGTSLAIDLLATNQTTVLFSADASENETNAAEAFCFRTTVAGTYYVRVRPASGGTGTYHLLVASSGQPLLQLSASNYVILENEGHLSIPVLRLGNTAGTVTVRLSTSNTTASAASDYGAFSQILTFTNGVASQVVSLFITNDTIPENNETLLLTLGAPTGGATIISPNPASVVILDDDEIPNNTSSTATPLDLSPGFAIVSNSVAATRLAISPGGDTDWFSFTAPPGSILWALVDTGGATALESNSRDAILTLFAQDGSTVIEQDDDDGSGSGFGLVLPSDGGSDPALAGRTLVAGGTYYLSVEAFSAAEIISPYTLLIFLSTASPLSEVEPNSTPALANPLVTASISSGERLAEVGFASDVDLYSVVVPSNCLLYVSADCDPERNGNATDLVVDLLGTDGSTVLFSADSAGAESAAAEAFCVLISAPGTYFIRVEGPPGLYTLMATRLSPEIEPNGTAGSGVLVELLNQFAATSGSVAPAADQDHYSFVAPPGGKLWAFVDTGGPQLPGATSRDSLLSVSVPGEVPVLEEDDNDGSGNGLDSSLESSDASVMGGVRLVSGGNYDLVVRAAQGGGVINPYTLFAVVTTGNALAEVENNDSPAMANSILAAAPALGLRSGSIANASDVDYFAVVATEGNQLLIVGDGDPDRTGSGTDIAIELLAPDGSTVLFSANSSAAGSVANPPAEGFCYRVPSSGIFFVKVMAGGSNLGLGTYQLMVARDNTLLRITSLDSAGGDVRISFPAELGRNYQAESTTNLNPGSWRPFSSPIPGSSRVANVLDIGGGTELQKFYRIRRVP